MLSTDPGVSHSDLFFCLSKEQTTKSGFIICRKKAQTVTETVCALCLLEELIKTNTEQHKDHERQKIRDIPAHPIGHL